MTSMGFLSASGHACGMMHARIANPWLRRKRSRHYRLMRKSQCYVYGKRPICIVWFSSVIWRILCLILEGPCESNLWFVFSIYHLRAMLHQVILKPANTNGLSGIAFTHMLSISPAISLLTFPLQWWHNGVMASQSAAFWLFNSPLSSLLPITGTILGNPLVTGGFSEWRANCVPFNAVIII